MVFHSGFLITTLLGFRVTWKAQRRGGEETGLREALARHGLHSLLALGLGGHRRLGRAGALLVALARLAAADLRGAALGVREPRSPRRARPPGRPVLDARGDLAAARAGGARGQRGGRAGGRSDRARRGRSLRQRAARAGGQAAPGGGRHARGPARAAAPARAGARPARPLAGRAAAPALGRGFAGGAPPRGVAPRGPPGPPGGLARPAGRVPHFGAPRPEPGWRSSSTSSGSPPPPRMRSSHARCSDAVGPKLTALGARGLTLHLSDADVQARRCARGSPGSSLPSRASSRSGWMRPTSARRSSARSPRRPRASPATWWSSRSRCATPRSARRSDGARRGS